MKNEQAGTWNDVWLNMLVCGERSKLAIAWRRKNKTITQAGSDQVNMKIGLKAASHHFRWVNDVEKTGGNPGVVLPQEMLR